MLHCSVPTLIPHVKRYAVESFHPHKCTLHILVYAVIWRSQNACISSSVPHKLCVSVHVSLTNCVYLFICRSQIACICSCCSQIVCICSSVANKLRASVHLSLKKCPLCRSQIACTCSYIAHKKPSLSVTNCVYLFICSSQEVQSVAHKLCVSVYLSLTNACLCAEASVTVTSVLGMLTSLPCNITPSLQDDRYSSSVFTKHRLCLFR